MQDLGRIALVGTGLLGASMGLAPCAAGFSGVRVGIGRRSQTVDQARQLGCVDEGCTSLKDGLGGCRLIVLATPIRTILELLPEVSRYADADAVVTDVGSTKAVIVEAAGRKLKAPERFLGSHPMAGGEQTGPGAARADLFQGKPCILTPTPGTLDRALEVVEGLWGMMGMKVLKMEPAVHDAAVARVSHLPHALAVLLVELAAQRGGLDVASTGFRDTTRVASSDAELWADIFLTNRAAVSEALEALGRETRRFQEILQTANREELVALLAASRRQREEWMKGKMWAREEG